MRRYLETPAPGFDQPLWTDPTKPGVVLGALPEDHDGGGAGVQDLAAAVEEARRVLHGAPLTTTLTAVRVLARYGSPGSRRPSTPRPCRTCRATA